MRRTNFLRTLVAGAVMLAGAGCTDLLLEPKSTVTGANIFNDTASYRSFLAKLYAGLAVTGQQGPAGQEDILGIDEGFSHYLRLLWQMQELPTDEAVLAWNDDAIQQLNTHTWNADNQFLTGMYYRIFFQVSMANEFLRETTDERLSERGVDDATRQEVQQFRAEARFLRALSYWHGIDIFGNIPLVDENFAVGATPPEQVSRQQLYDFVVSELQAINSELPSPGAGEYGRADQGAVAMLLAKLYMNAEVYTGSANYSGAMAEAQRVISSGMYRIEDNHRLNFLADNHTSDEIIFAVPQDGRRTRSFGGTTFLLNASVGGNMNNSSYGVPSGGWWGLRGQPELIGLFPASGDRRFDDVVFSDGHTLSIGELTNFFSGYAMPKFENNTSGGAAGSDPLHPDTDYPMFRLADAYLMYIEAHLRGGGGSETEALAYANELRERAYGDDSGNITSGDLTLDWVLDERARELYWEGHRRTDLIRFDVFTGSDRVWEWKGNAQAGTGIPSHFDLYPLPASELTANSTLSQNPGYGVN